ncbi:metallopeptidase family protein [Chloroflexi bacterium TSY]|nr:metallopeptidase family protein [Chloroflexi bacterium TSY]
MLSYRDQISPERFEELVEEAIESIPDALWEATSNIAVFVEEWPSRSQMDRVGMRHGHLLLGLYEGVPLTKRSRGYNLVPPDKITIFRGPILQICPQGNEKVIRNQVRRTVLHEVAHHFGISDARLRELGAY